MPRNPSWRGLASLVRDAVDATTDLVGVGHASAHRGVQRAADVAGVGGPVRPVREVVHLGTRGTLATVKAVNHLVGKLAEVALKPGAGVTPDMAPVPLRSDVVGEPSWLADAAVAALNASIGDHLAATDNPLDIGLSLRVGGRYLKQDDTVDGPLVVAIHGLGTTEWCWTMDAEEVFGAADRSLPTLLADDLGSTSILVRYNTGRRIAANGIELAEALERAVDGSGPIVVVGHSMGGLVARAAATHARAHDHRWIDRVTWVITLGTPHQGAPLARLGASLTAGLASIDTPTPQILAGILRGRSGGVRDLEHGDVHGGPHPALPSDAMVELVAGPRYAFLGTTVFRSPDNPAGRWVGDLLVQTASAGGPRNLASPVDAALLGGVPHHRIQADARVLEAVRTLLQDG